MNFAIAGVAGFLIGRQPHPHLGVNARVDDARHFLGAADDVIKMMRVIVRKS